MLHFIDIPQEVLPMGPINNNTLLVQIVNWSQIDKKSLSESMVVLFNESYIHAFFHISVIYVVIL